MTILHAHKGWILNNVLYYNKRRFEAFKPSIKTQKHNIMIIKLVHTTCNNIFLSFESVSLFFGHFGGWLLILCELFP